MTNKDIQTNINAEYWQTQGWKQEHINGHEVYTGMYRVSRGEEKYEYDGYILLHRTSRVQLATIELAERVAFDVMIKNPPHAIKSHPEGACFQLLNGDIYRIHYAVEPRAVDEAILHIERVLAESLFPQR